MCLSHCRSLVFFFKQKPAYDMRISDWSSDVCSSDLTEAAQPGAVHGQRPEERAHPGPKQYVIVAVVLAIVTAIEVVLFYLDMPDGALIAGLQIGRASCREEGGSTCRSRWSPYHSKKKNKNKKRKQKSIHRVQQ